MSNCNIVFSVLLFCGLCQSIPTWSEDYSEYPIYPFQQYTQVRKTYSVEHLPAQLSEEESHPSGHTIQPAATSHYHSYKPRLTEEIQTWGKQEVYEEKGYADSAYDHHKHGNPHDLESGQSTAGVHHYKDLAGNDGTSTDLLSHAASVLYDSAAHQHGIYKARSGRYCPPVVNFDLSSKSMKMGKGQERPPGKPRLGGLGSRISCLRKKYFGDKPFPPAIFKHPEESRKALIGSGSMEQFMEDQEHPSLIY